MKLNSEDNPLRREMMIYSFVGLMMVVLGIAGAVSYKLDGDLELLIVSIASLIGGLGVLLTGAVRKDLYDHMTVIENLLQR